MTESKTGVMLMKLLLVENAFETQLAAVWLDSCLQFLTSPHVCETKISFPEMLVLVVHFEFTS